MTVQDDTGDIAERGAMVGSSRAILKDPLDDCRPQKYRSDLKVLLVSLTFCSDGVIELVARCTIAADEVALGGLPAFRVPILQESSSGCVVYIGNFDRNVQV